MQFCRLVLCCLRNMKQEHWISESESSIKTWVHRKENTQFQKLCFILLWFFEHETMVEVHKPSSHKQCFHTCCSVARVYI
jgi:hypothetical protein